LATRYDITGPSNVMWTVDIEIRDEIARLVANPEAEGWEADAAAVLERADEMIYKEANILSRSAPRTSPRPSGARSVAIPTTTTPA